MPSAPAEGQVQTQMQTPPPCHKAVTPIPAAELHINKHILQVIVTLGRKTAQPLYSRSKMHYALVLQQHIGNQPAQ